MEYRKENNQIIVRIARGEKIIESLKQVVKKESIQGAFLVGLGAVDELEIAHYSVADQKYSTQEFEEALEVTNMTGNVSFVADEIMIHVHGTFSRPDMTCLGGHVVEARVSGTFEACLFTTDKMVRKEDKETGLKLIDLS